MSNSNPIGKITYALRIEFQMRGSPHLHALIWTSDCPKLAAETKDAYVEYIDKHVQAFLPNENEDPELYNLVKMYQKAQSFKNLPKVQECKLPF